MALLALIELTINNCYKMAEITNKYVHVKMQMVVMAAPSINNHIFMYQKDHPLQAKSEYGKPLNPTFR
jgi:hypothetical protein